MKLSLPENVSKLRKEHSMTQEQLAEALGVTFASVSKWERGVATPELNMIAQMADLFEVSIDALIGYKFRNNDREHVIERLKQYLHDKNRQDIYDDIEKSLTRYPNCFEVVYYSASIYRVRGLCQKQRSYSKKAISLYEQACILISQNTDPEISTISIYREIAETYLILGEYDKGLDILMRHNPCYLNHSQIGYTLASSCNGAKEALPYLSKALLDMTQKHIEIVMGYLNIYIQTKQLDEALAMTDWALAFYPGLRNPEKPTYMDKSEAVLWANRAGILLSLGRKKEATDSLCMAKSVALRFDKTPNYDAASIRFVDSPMPATAFDDFGMTAMLGIENLIEHYGEHELLKLWMTVKDEEASE